MRVSKQNKDFVASFLIPADISTWAFNNFAFQDKE
jgi:hypothetical protein